MCINISAYTVFFELSSMACANQSSVAFLIVWCAFSGSIYFSIISSLIGFVVCWRNTDKKEEKKALNHFNCWSYKWFFRLCSHHQLRLIISSEYFLVLFREKRIWIINSIIFNWMHKMSRFNRTSNHLDC